MIFPLLVALGGALGALCRYSVYLFCQYLGLLAFPWNTFFVNTTGALIIGIFMGFAVDKLMLFEYWHAFFVIGFLGGYTTFSSFAFETINFIDDGNFFLAAANIFSNNIGVLLATWFGLRLGEIIGNM